MITSSFQAEPDVSPSLPCPCQVGRATALFRGPKLVATEDRMIPPPKQRAMSERAGSTVVEASGSHAIYLSQPAAVPSLIEQATFAVAAR